MALTTSEGLPITTPGTGDDHRFRSPPRTPAKRQADHREGVPITACEHRQRALLYSITAKHTPNTIR
eukprot:15445003-Alexandrium_andersonii.AAC.1